MCFMIEPARKIQLTDWHLFPFYKFKLLFGAINLCTLQPSKKKKKLYTLKKNLYCHHGTHIGFFVSKSPPIDHLAICSHGLTAHNRLRSHVYALGPSPVNIFANYITNRFIFDILFSLWLNFRLLWHYSLEIRWLISKCIIILYRYSI
jgi:hypothetical protein